MRQNQSQVDGRTPTTNSLHQGTPGQHWMSARPMSAHFLHDLHPCFTGFDGFAPVFGEGLVVGLRVALLTMVGELRLAQ